MDDGMTGVRPCWSFPVRLSSLQLPQNPFAHSKTPFSHFWLCSVCVRGFRIEKSYAEEYRDKCSTSEADTDVPGTTSNAIASEPTMQPGCPFPRGCCRCNYHSRA
ncbi:hypothetical protein CCUS01_09143 [Colletotrichum cuscutae]|uniref:Uncharacterized protein n=1 Tax=Colletotrichum cuscutae TaxID=1209917 RepID=A0AAI9XT35_9PEZI|nr:hypothetical protein CCUS01_09143 [Colletotrichum cuscutae]